MKNCVKVAGLALAATLALSRGAGLPPDASDAWLARDFQAWDSPNERIVIYEGTTALQEYSSHSPLMVFYNDRVMDAFRSHSKLRIAHNHTLTLNYLLEHEVPQEERPAVEALPKDLLESRVCRWQPSATDIGCLLDMMHRFYTVNPQGSIEQRLVVIQSKRVRWVLEFGLSPAAEQRYRALIKESPWKPPSESQAAVYPLTPIAAFQDDILGKYVELQAPHIVRSYARPDSEPSFGRFLRDVNSSPDFRMRVLRWRE